MSIELKEAIKNFQESINGYKKFYENVPINEIETKMNLVRNQFYQSIPYESQEMKHPEIIKIIDKPLSKESKTNSNNNIFDINDCLNELIEFEPYTGTSFLLQIINNAENKMHKILA